MRLAFMGSPDFAVPTLTALLNAGHEIACVYTQPPRPAGRGQKDRPCPVHAFAAERGLPVRTPGNFKDPADIAAWQGLTLDAAVVAAYGLILPAEILDAPRLGCFNVHASLLPRWRGAAPIHRAILAGDVLSGVTIMGMEQGLDTGPIYLQGKTPITPSTTASALHDALAKLGAELMAEALPAIASRTLNAAPQPEDGVIYAEKLRREEGLISWSRPAAEIERKVRAFNPWPGVWFEHRGERFKVLAAHVVDVVDIAATGPGARPGTVVQAPLVVACGEDSLAVDRLQRPGKGALAVEDFVRGYDFEIGSQLG